MLLLSLLFVSCGVFMVAMLVVEIVLYVVIIAVVVFLSCHLVKDIVNFFIGGGFDS